MKYTSDSISKSVIINICDHFNIPYQFYANRSDMAGGSTLGNISNSHVSLNTIDIGLAQLSMHSSFETAGSYDIDHLINLSKHFYSSSISIKNDEIKINY